MWKTIQKSGCSSKLACFPRPALITARYLAHKLEAWTIVSAKRKLTSPKDGPGLIKYCFLSSTTQASQHNQPEPELIFFISNIESIISFQDFIRVIVKWVKWRKQQISLGLLRLFNNLSFIIYHVSFYFFKLCLLGIAFKSKVFALQRHCWTQSRVFLQLNPCSVVRRCQHMEFQLLQCLTQMMKKEIMYCTLLCVSIWW